MKSSVHVHREPVRDKEWKADEMEIRLDDRTASAAETRALGIEVGDFIAWDPRTVVTDTGYVKSRHLDDKAGVAVMLAALRTLAESGLMPAQRTTFHFSNFEEVGHGASAGIPDDVAELIAVDIGGWAKACRATTRRQHLRQGQRGAVRSRHPPPAGGAGQATASRTSSTSTRSMARMRRPRCAPAVIIASACWDRGWTPHTRLSARIGMRWTLRRDYCWLICSD